MATGRRYLLTMTLVLAALAACAQSATAATKDFGLEVAPSSVPSGVVVDVSATFTNLTATQRLGSANLRAPQGYVVQSILSLSRPAPATATLAGGVVELRNLSLPPGGTATVTMRVSTPCAPGATAQWDDVAVKQANDFNGNPGNDLTLDPAQSSLTTTTIGACVPCPENETCSTGLDAPSGSALGLRSDPSSTQVDAGLLTISLSGGLDCAGYSERASHTFRFDAPQNRAKVGTLTYDATTRAITSRDPLEVCFGSPSAFAVKPKTTQTTAVIDGQFAYVGRLPNCLGLTPPPCVLDRDDTARSITFTMLPGDPWTR
jgi:hypothetical protein